MGIDHSHRRSVQRITCLLFLTSYLALAGEDVRKSSLGILFRGEKYAIFPQEERKIDILIPYPNITLPEINKIETTVKKVHELWKKSSRGCANLSEYDTPNDTLFVNATEMLQTELAVTIDTQTEIKERLKDMFPQRETTPIRKKRTLPIVAAMAAVGIGAAVAGVYLSNGCLFGFIGNCQNRKEIELQRRKIQQIIQSHNRGMEQLFITSATSDNKFMIIGNSLQEMEEQMNKLMKIEGENWNTTQNILQEIVISIHEQRMCDVYLLKRTELLHARQDILTNLNDQIGKLRHMRNELFTYESKVIEAIQMLSQRRIPPTLIPPKELRRLNKLMETDLRNNTNLTMAIDRNNWEVMYELQTVTQAITLEFGIALQIMIPLVHKDYKAEKVYRAIPIPMPLSKADNITDDASVSLGEPIENLAKWTPETTFYANMERTGEHIAITDEEWALCRGTEKLNICPTFALRTEESTCIDMLFSKPYQAHTICDVEITQTPIKPQFHHLGKGYWGVRSMMKDWIINIIRENGTTESKQGCVSCVLHLQCGDTIKTKTATIRPIKGECDKTRLPDIHTKTSPTLQRLYSTVQIEGNLPNALIPAEINNLLKQIQINNLTIPNTSLHLTDYKQIKRPLELHKRYNDNRITSLDYVTSVSKTAQFITIVILFLLIVILLIVIRNRQRRLNETTQTVVYQDTKIEKMQRAKLRHSPTYKNEQRVRFTNEPEDIYRNPQSILKHGETEQE